MIKEQEAGLTVAEVCRKYGISPASFFKLKAKFGGMDVSDARRFMQLKDRDASYVRHLPTTDILISQQQMGRDRLNIATNLRVIFTVETNFLPNIDYEECFQRGIQLLILGAVFALPVAKMALGMALSLARNIQGEHAAFQTGQEK